MKIRRLILCLDGTWNNRDDSTNVLHHYSLAFECADKPWREDSVTQQRYYHPGVGTGPLDRITGGGFGFGLEANIRDAYNWLVQNFEEGDAAQGGPARPDLKAPPAGTPPDEIYIFGFSRGAYTARSLVGFIGTCGLLRRGAPLTVTELWENYCILGREREQRGNSSARKVFGTPPKLFRRITELVCDPWLVQPGVPVPLGGVPGLWKNDLTPTEQLLVRWSRRVKITYLGVYDTVGAMGWDALAIPGLRSKLAVHHNLRPTTIIQKCRHALAIDEHRSSFHPSPFVCYIGEATSGDEIDRLAPSSSTRPPSDGKFKMTAEKWQAVEQRWTEKIEQRWFVGAHANIGGGYPDNRLAERPLQWLLEGARAEGLIVEKLSEPAALTNAQVRPNDSYAEFAKPLWTMVLRAKRHYRRINPKPELRANRDEAKNKGEPKAGFSLVSIHETVDDSVLQYWSASKEAPPNLVEWAQREKQVEAQPDRAKHRAALANKACPLAWPGDGWVTQFGLALWAILAAAGLQVAHQFFRIWPGAAPPFWVLCVLAGVLPLVDWAESFVNSQSARLGSTPRRRAFSDSIYWIRALGVVLFAFGVCGTIVDLGSAAWQALSWADASRAAGVFSAHARDLALAASAGLLVAHLLARSSTGRFISALIAVVMAIGLAWAAVALVIRAAFAAAWFTAAALGIDRTAVAALPSPEQARVAGLVLLLECAVFYFLRAFSWVSEPMDEANLGGITDLQKRMTPSGVKACLDRWCKMLGDHHDEEASECAMTCVVKEALWRDTFGFIPVYTGLAALGLWLGAGKLDWAASAVLTSYASWLAPLVEHWWILPLVAFLCDYVENACHFHYLALHENGKSPSAAIAGFCFLMTAVKTVAFGLAMAAVAAALLHATWLLVFHPREYGWRGLLALAVVAGALLSALVLAIWGRVYRLLSKRDKIQNPAANREA